MSAVTAAAPASPFEVVADMEGPLHQATARVQLLFNGLEPAAARLDKGDVLVMLGDALRDLGKLGELWRAAFQGLTATKRAAGEPGAAGTSAPTTCEDGQVGDAYDLLVTAQDASHGLMLIGEDLSKAGPQPDGRWKAIACLADFIGSNIEFAIGNLQRVYPDLGAE